MIYRDCLPAVLKKAPSNEAVQGRWHSAIQEEQTHTHCYCLSACTQTLTDRGEGRASVEHGC